MEYKLERKIILNESKKNWCLNETDENGNKIDNWKNDLIPVNFGKSFIASSLKVERKISSKEDRRYEVLSENYDQKFEERIIKEESKIFITGNLHPEKIRHTKEDSFVSYKMFGTDREIKDFTTFIYKNSSDDDKEYCRLCGAPSFDYEIDFRVKTNPDYLQFDIFLNENNFDKLVSLIESKQIDKFSIYIAGVEGFYSYWSPESGREFFKILTDSHIVETNKESKTKLPKLSNQVINFFEIKTSYHLNLKPDFKSIDAENEVCDSVVNTEIDNKDLTKVSFKDNHDHCDKVDSTLYVLKIVNGLKLPLWFILVVLLLLLVK